MELIVVSYVVIFGFMAVCYWLYNRMDRVSLLQKHGETYRLIKAMRIYKGADEARFGNKTYLLRGGYSDGGRMIYHLDFNSGKPLQFNAAKGNMLSPEDADTFLSSKLMNGVVRLMKPSTANSILTIVLPIACLIVGFLLGHFLGGGTVEHAAENIIIIHGE